MSFPNEDYVEQKSKMRNDRFAFLQKKKACDLKQMAKELDVKSTGTKAHLCKRIQRAEFHYSHRPTQPLFVKKLNKTQFLQIDTFQKFFSLVFENDYAIGKFDHRIETVKPLTKDDIQICKQIGVPFHIPTILEGKHQTHRIRQILDEEESDEENI